MDYQDYVAQAMQQSQDPREAWWWALAERNRNPDQQLANAEHYLWNQYYSGKGPFEAAGGLLTPIGYYLGKKTGLLGGRSPATLKQLEAGIRGAFAGMGWNSDD